MRAEGVHHLAVRTPDLVSSERFYVEILGLTVRERFFFEDGSPRSVWVALAEGSFLALELGPVGPSPRDDDPGWHCVALRIDRSEREAWRERLEASGVRVERETDYTLYVRDPSGALVGLSHHPDPQSTQPRLTPSDAPRSPPGSPHRS